MHEVLSILQHECVMPFLSTIKNASEMNGCMEFFGAEVPNLCLHMQTPQIKIKKPWANPESFFESENTEYSLRLLSYPWGMRTTSSEPLPRRQNIFLLSKSNYKDWDCRLPIPRPAWNSIDPVRCSIRRKRWKRSWRGRSRWRGRKSSSCWSRGQKPPRRRGIRRR